MTETAARNNPDTSNGSQGGVVDKCSDCGAALPLRAPRTDEEPGHWICTECGGSLEALFDTDAAPEIRENVRPAAVDFDRSQLQQPFTAIADFVTRLESQQDSHDEKRAVVRRALGQPVAVMPLDEQFRPIGDCFLAVTRDVSQQGIAVVHTRPVEADYLAVELSCARGNKLQVAMQIVRRRELGDYHESAGPFLTKLGASEANGPDSNRKSC